MRHIFRGLCSWLRERLASRFGYPTARTAAVYNYQNALFSLESSDPLMLV
jgi:hypothetical protein